MTHAVHLGNDTVLKRPGFQPFIGDAIDQLDVGRAAFSRCGPPVPHQETRWWQSSAAKSVGTDTLMMDAGRCGIHVNHCREVQLMKQTAVRLPEATYNRLQVLATHTPRTATFYIREAIEQHLEDLEDLHTAEKAAIEHRKAGERTLSIDELDRYLGLES